MEKLRIVTQYPKVDYDKTVIQALMLLNEEGSFHGIGEIVSVVLCILIPLGFAAMVTRAAVVEKEYKSPPASYNYLASRKMIERKDEPSSRIADFLGL